MRIHVFYKHNDEKHIQAQILQKLRHCLSICKPQFYKISKHLSPNLQKNTHNVQIAPLHGIGIFEAQKINFAKHNEAKKIYPMLSSAKEILTCQKFSNCYLKILRNWNFSKKSKNWALHSCLFVSSGYLYRKQYINQSRTQSNLQHFFILLMVVLQSFVSTIKIIMKASEQRDWVRVCT